LGPSGPAGTGPAFHDLARQAPDRLRFAHQHDGWRMAEAMTEYQPFYLDGNGNYWSWDGEGRSYWRDEWIDAPGATPVALLEPEDDPLPQGARPAAPCYYRASDGRLYPAPPGAPLEVPPTPPSPAPTQRRRRAPWIVQSVKGQVRSSASDGSDDKSVANMSCVPPDFGKAGKTFTCYGFKSGGRGAGEYDGTVLPSEAEGTPQWTGSWSGG
jgi:hypothetical protein